MDPILYSAISDFKLPLPEKQPRELMIAQMFSLLLHHKNHVPEDVLVYLENHHIYLGNGGFILTAFRPNNAKIQDQIYGFLNNLEALVRQQYEGTGIFYAQQVGMQIIVVSCFPRLTQEQQKENSLYTQAEQQAKRIVNLCQTYWNIELYAAIGALVYGVDNISGAYYMLSKLMDYKCYTHDSSQILYAPKPLQLRQHTQNFSDIQKLAIYIASEIKNHTLTDIPGCASELSQMFVRCKVPSISNLHALILFFLQTFEEELINFDVVDNDSLIELDFLGTLYQAADISELTQQMIDLVINIQTLYHFHCKKKNKQLIAEAKLFIDQNFRSQELSVSQIAETIGMNQNALSKLFKVQMGLSPLAYIHKCRVACAKKLLAETKYTLIQIAQCAGFGSATSMYRVFKSVEGLSPGKFR